MTRHDRPVPVVHRHPRRNGVARLDPRAALSRGGRPLPTVKPPPITARSFDLLPFRPGALAGDVARHIWPERGRFSPTLYDPRV